VDLVAVLRRNAEGTGRPLDRLSAGRDRYGPVDALLFAGGGYISVHASTEHGYDIMVWADQPRVLGLDLVAWGHTASENDIVETMYRWQGDSSAASVRAHSEYLTVTDETNIAAAVEALWQVLLQYGDEEVADIASVAAEDPTLRRLRPWVSHGTLHLLRPHDRISTAQHGLAFLPAGGNRFQVSIYDHDVSPLLEDTQAAVAFASKAATAW
jgi:hypothetical protein